MRLFVSLVAMIVVVAAGRFLGIEQASTLADQAMAVASAHVRTAGLSDSAPANLLDGRLVKTAALWATTATTSIPPLQWRKEDAADDLEDVILLGAIDFKTMRRIERALNHIDKSLKADLWDGNRPDPRKGGKIFDEEEKAALEIQRVLGLDLEGSGKSAKGKSKKSKSSKSGGVGFMSQEEEDLLDVLAELADVDDTLADRAIVLYKLKVKQFGCDPDGNYRDPAVSSLCRANRRVIRRAENEYERGQTEVMLENFAAAIRHFKAAWQLVPGAP